MASSAMPTRRASHKKSIPRQVTACNYFFLALDAPEPTGEGGATERSGGAEISAAVVGSRPTR